MVGRLADVVTLNERTIQRIAEAEGVPCANAKNQESIQIALESGSETARSEFIEYRAPGILIHRK